MSRPPRAHVAAVKRARAVLGEATGHSDDWRRKHAKATGTALEAAAKRDIDCIAGLVGEHGNASVHPLAVLMALATGAFRLATGRVAAVHRRSDRINAYSGTAAPFMRAVAAFVPGGLTDQQIRQAMRNQRAQA